MTLDEAVDYYHSLLKFGIKPGLERIGILCERLGSPHKKLEIIHIAGTNGKGSTCTALASVLCKAGYRTGLYTSPYVTDFRERIQLNSEMISPDDLIKYTLRVRSAVEELSAEGTVITEFEAVTAAAFLYYAEKGCDYVVLETGLGGRFDATNIIPAPVCSIITSVSFDHTGVLGNTIAEIAFEKSGIIKKGCPVITSVLQPDEVKAVISRQAEERSSELILRDPDELFEVVSEDITGTTVKSLCGITKIPFTGLHQLDNMALVTGAVGVLRRKGCLISDAAVLEGIASARIPARTEIISTQPLVILDGSHNDGSTAALGDVLRKHLGGKRILAVMGMMADKDCRKALSNVVPCFSEVITVTPSNPRSMPSAELARLVESFSVKSTAIDSPVEGIKAAMEKIGEYDALTVCGSLYLAGDVRDSLKNICG